MSNTPDWSQAVGFMDFNDAELETAFNDAIGNVSFDPGTHKDVRVDSLELKQSQAGNMYVRVALVNDDGAKITTNIMLKKNEDGKAHFTYQRFAGATVPDRAVRMEVFGKIIPAKPNLFDALKGIKVNIKVDQGKEGYVLRKSDLTGNVVIIDAETNEAYTDIGEVEFETFKEAADKAKEEGLRRCYNEVTDVRKGTDESVEGNTEIVQSLLRAAEGQAAGVAKPQSAAVRSML